ncbi:AIM24 family protein [uncultured Anaerococcus sp.]|uniref:AIM24 family protein n=1 Tax=uncultured Anaerococcus sp. TaxID=293428 RepID=UPI002602662B|nr:AIM24 family protein [uncultured Anaerococcus sp.]
MFKINNFIDNDDVLITQELGAFKFAEFKRDLSVNKETAEREYFASQMGVRLKQLVCDLSVSPVTLQQGAMQWMVGDVRAKTGIKGVGDFIGKGIRASVSKETIVKPEYEGSGLVVLEPTYKYIVLIDLNTWNNSIVLEDGYFLACESSLAHKTVARTSFSSTVAGNEGLFNLGLHGSGVVALESPVAKNELIEVELIDDELKVDGSFAIAWSNTLKFTVERTTKSLVGSAASGEGLVNVYRGTGKVLMAPVAF